MTTASPLSTGRLRSRAVRRQSPSRRRWSCYRLEPPCLASGSGRGVNAVGHGKEKRVRQPQGLCKSRRHHMTRRFLCGWVVIAFALLSLSTAGARAQTVAPGPYYATPSWDQTLACNTIATCPRFIVLSNMNSDAVLDRETGLVWERAPSTFPPLSWLH